MMMPTYVFSFYSSYSCTLTQSRDMPGQQKKQCISKILFSNFGLDNFFKVAFWNESKQKAIFLKLGDCIWTFLVAGGRQSMHAVLYKRFSLYTVYTEVDKVN